MKNKKVKVAVAMSGGVDSSVAAVFLKKQGYDIFGVFMHFWSENVKGRTRDNICCSLESHSPRFAGEAGEDARRVCRKLGIPFYTMNMSVPFKKKIVDDFICQYGACRTPNPCVRCNQYIKFGKFFKKAKALGADRIATGHYAKIVFVKTQHVASTVRRGGYFKLLKSKDKEKDQTYFLHQMTQAQLKHVLFPIGKYTKPEVRKLAEKFGLAVHDKKESQEICFIPSGDTSEFLRRHLRSKKGVIKDVSTGKTIGEHAGLISYTVGQRKGIGLSGGPWYVSRLDRRNNVLWVTKNEKDLLQKKLSVKNMNWISGVVPKLPIQCKCKIRYRADEVECLVDVIQSKPGKYIVKFKRPARAVTAGQYCVFWNGGECLGGGEIV